MDDKMLIATVIILFLPLITMAALLIKTCFEDLHDTKTQYNKNREEIEKILYKHKY